jgi:predicted nucleic-acid-binding Zn-ribbon protein
VEKGVCPKCGSSEVYRRRGGMASSHGVFLLLSLLRYLEIDTYVCTNCGYIENYTADKYRLPEIVCNKKWEHVRQ